MRKLLFLFGTGLAVWAGAFALGPIGDAAAQTPEAGAPAPAAKRYTIRTDVTMVTTDVTVVGPEMTDLGKEDLVVYDNGVAHPVTYLSRNQLPLAIGLLIDTSLSVQPYLPLIQVAAGAALRSMRPEDTAVLYAFNASPDRRSRLTNDRVEIAQKISKLQFNMGTDIYSTISDAARYLQKEAPNYRRALIMISDNYHVTMVGGFTFGMGMAGSIDMTEQDSSADAARARSLEAAATIHSIRTPSVGADSTGSVPRIRRIVADTGGETLDITGWTSLQAAMEEILLKLRKQYTIGFNPTDFGPDGSYHKLEIKFADPNRCPECRILARSGYYAGVASPQPAEGGKIKNPKHSREEADAMIIQQSIVTAGTYVFTSGFQNTAEDAVANMRQSDLGDIKVRASARPTQDAGGKKVMSVDVSIDTDRVKFNRIGDLWGCKLHIGLFYFNEYMNYLGSEVRILEGQLSEETYRKTVESGIVYTGEIPLKVPKQSVKVVVYDENSDRAGSKLVPWVPPAP